MNISHKWKRSKGLRFGLYLAAPLLWSRAGNAEVQLAQTNGWTFTFDGRVNAFLSGGKGDDFPLPTPEPTGLAHAPFTANHLVMGSNSNNPGNGRADVGWPGNYGQQDVNNKYLGVRVRSGMFGNILGFGVARQVGESTTVKAYVSIWSTVESLGYDKWAPINAEAREGYFTATGPWGSATVGRTLGWLGRTSYEIDVAYGHGFGVGLPCTDALGPACGHIGTGALFPGYSAGIAYSTPPVLGFQLNVGAYDPVVFATAAQDWSHAGMLRPEGSATFQRQLGPRVWIKLGLEGLYQRLTRIRSDTDATGAVVGKHNVSTSVWGVSGGGRLELGPLRVGGAVFRGRGVGLSYALQRSVATEDNDSGHLACLDTDGDPTTPCVNTASYALRTFTGYYGQAAIVVARVHLSAGYGISIVDRVPNDLVNTTQSAFHYQAGISAAVYYHLSDSVVLGLDYFHYVAHWYGAPVADPVTMQATGQRLAGEKQVLDFLNAGVTYHW